MQAAVLGQISPPSALNLCIMKTYCKHFTLIQACSSSHQNTLCSRTHQSAKSPSQSGWTWRTNCMVCDYLSFSFGAATSSHFHTVGETSHLLSLNRLRVLKSSHWAKKAEESTGDTWMNCDVLVQRWTAWQMSQSPQKHGVGIYVKCLYLRGCSVHSSWRKEIYMCTPSNSSLQCGKPFVDDCCSDTLFAPPFVWYIYQDSIVAIVGSQGKATFLLIIWHRLPLFPISDLCGTFAADVIHGASKQVTPSRFL